MVVDSAPHGPRKIGAKNQVAVPAELLEAIGAQVGDGLWFAINPDRPGTLVVLSRSQAIEVFNAGWSRTRPELPN
jgi:bifunctional DNA-binding transcriptional regulator/antitoxin component of YhaV-PrlF toxin-antitoxin module